MKALLRYVHTVRYMKPGQVYHRLRRYWGLECRLSVLPSGVMEADKCRPVHTVRELDFDPVFLARFPVEALMQDYVCFLHETERFSWDEKWEFTNRSPLWNYHLHYFEYGFSLIEAYRKTGARAYANKLKSIIESWIKWNPQKNGGPGWAPYTISMRLTNWMSFYTLLSEEWEQDEAFCEQITSSIYEQYVYLSRHLEKDIMGNHYLENLKALILCSVFFGDDAVLRCSIRVFKEQCKEQILHDGMHFERSPMYHKMMLEAVLRTAVALRGAGRPNKEIESYLPVMVDAAYSLEEGLERLPLFNDCGDNMAKSLQALCLAAENHFGIVPQSRAQLPDSGYYIFKQGSLKLIVNAGQPCPPHVSGHAHCDAMSFELFQNGKPLLVNCGTYGYQCEERVFFRSTAAHNTVMADDTEQSQCWGVFRLAKRAWVRVIHVDTDGMEMSVKDHRGHVVTRRIVLRDSVLMIEDRCKGHVLKAWMHGWISNVECVNGTICCMNHPYAPSYGLRMIVPAYAITGKDVLRYCVHLEVPEGEDG